MSDVFDIAGRARRFPRWPKELQPRTSSVDADALPALALTARGPVASPAADFVAGDFDMATIRPVREILPGRRADSLWGVALSLFAHVGALTALLLWSTPVVEPPSPEAIAVEIIVEPSDTAVAPTPPAEQPPVVEPPPPPVVEPLAPVAEAPPRIVEAPPPPPPAAAEPPPPPVAEPPPAVVEAPPPVEPPPPPVAAEPPPPPVVEQPPPVAVAPPPPEPPPPRVVAPLPKPPAPAKAHVEPPRRVAPVAAPSKPAPSKPAAAPAVSSAAASAYQGAVLDRIAARTRYPEAARERGPHGVAVVAFTLDASGQVADASVSRSAGDPVLDADALATVRRAAPFPPPPAGAPRRYSAQLRYRVP